MDSDSTKIRSHCEVGNGASEQRDCEQVVEDTLSLLGEEGQSDNDEEGEGVDSAHGPEPVRATDAEVSVADWRVDVQSIVAASDETHLDWILGLRRLSKCLDV